MEKYQDWSKVLIEPASMNDARLFSLESRVHEEEEIRIKEYEFLRDSIKKLIYSFEQSNIGTIDEMISTTGNNNKSNNEAFNQPLNHNTSKKSGTASGQAKILLNTSSV